MEHANRSKSRRGILKLLAGVAGILGLSASGVQAKTSKSAAAYRGLPNGRQSCANCSWFEPPSGCGVVRGPVSVRGWCNLWG